MSKLKNLLGNLGNTGKAIFGILVFGIVISSVSFAIGQNQSQASPATKDGKAKTGYWLWGKCLATGPSAKNGTVFVLLSSNDKVVQKKWFQAPASIAAMVNETALTAIENDLYVHAWVQSKTGGTVWRFHAYAKTK